MAIDERTKKLANLVVNYSLKVMHDENVIIVGSTEAEPFIVALYEEVLKAGGHPILRLSVPGLDPIYFKYAKEHHLKRFPEYYDYTVKNAQKFIGISSEANTRELSSADPKKIAERSKIVRPISDYIVNQKDKIRRCSVGYPTQALAQDAEMSLAEYEDFVFGACLQDWKKLGSEMDKILALFKKGKEVHLKGDNVDLYMQIHGDKAVADKGEENMPGGEIFMAPVRESLKGWIKFDYPAIRSGNEVTGIRVEFENGKAVKTEADKNEKFLRDMLAVDENASYIGELGIGCNPMVDRFTKDLLFDEKIGGTIHLAFGVAYTENGGGNDSALHWDIVKDMHKGEIILDGKTVQKNGKWLLS
ncbi:MAG TPA: aminopeptidase [bacterium]|nr:aminopeptidase [bacterium]